MKNVQKKYKMDKKQQGKRNRRMGAEFERRVRNDLSEKGWIVDRWTNNVELGIETSSKKIIGRLIQAKSNRFNMRTTGFPDFIAFKESVDYDIEEGYGDKKEVIGVECKTNGYLTREEKEKCKWLLRTKIFSRILIASKQKTKNRIKIVYTEFKW